MINKFLFTYFWNRNFFCLYKFFWFYKSSYLCILDYFICCIFIYRI